MDNQDYEKLLKKAENVLSKSNMNQQRLQIPDPDVIQEGKATIIRNFTDIADMITFFTVAGRKFCSFHSINM